MGIGELANFAAYAFAPASLVTPLGAVSVLVSAILSSRLLNEKLNLLGKLGCVLCVVGSTVIVIHSPKNENVASFIVYSILVIVISLILICYFEPKCGQTNILVYILICSLLGSLSVMGAKGLGIAIKETMSGRNEFTNWLTWICLFSLIFFIVVQTNYLNKALDVYNTSVVTPIYYVLFTTFVILASTILYKEWLFLSLLDILGSICGFLTVILAVFLLNAFKDLEISLSNLLVHVHRQEYVVNDEETAALTGNQLTVSSKSSNARLNR
uniref:Magnesium transporter NIPA2 n=1 Tax=Strigamia maritima TaxID=126957 RepID=T1J0J6_STRMM